MHNELGQPLGTKVTISIYEKLALPEPMRTKSIIFPKCDN